MSISVGKNPVEQVKEDIHAAVHPSTGKNPTAWCFFFPTDGLTDVAAFPLHSVVQNEISGGPSHSAEARAAVTHPFVHNNSFTFPVKHRCLLAGISLIICLN